MDFVLVSCAGIIEVDEADILLLGLTVKDRAPDPTVPYPLSLDPLVPDPLVPKAVFIPRPIVPPLCLLCSIA